MRRPTAVPDITFSARMTLELGDKQVELIHVGRNHSDNSIVTLFPEERTLFAVDFMSTRRLPFRTDGVLRGRRGGYEARLDTDDDEHSRRRETLR